MYKVSPIRRYNFFKCSMAYRPIQLTVPISIAEIDYKNNMRSSVQISFLCMFLLVPHFTDNERNGNEKLKLVMVGTFMQVPHATAGEIPKLS